ncbi:MAG TPA: hypothetical protein VN203_20150 [Candidatus Acidoferrum sp.]|nr:hypothetical protein [Candidatus Acidoferrum sp.]
MPEGEDEVFYPLEVVATDPAIHRKVLKDAERRFREAKAYLEEVKSLRKGD